MRAGACAVALSLALFGGSCAWHLSRRAAPEAPRRPELVLLIVVDQLPEATWSRLLPRYSANGFRRLVRDGRLYADAHHDHAATLTAVGHASLITGDLPARHGIVGNDWVDRATGQFVYCVGPRDDPTPEMLLVPTLGDRLVDQTGGAARVWAVSIKDRASVILAGRRGRALWYDGASGAFRLRTPDGEPAPGWTRAWIGGGDGVPAPAARFAGAQWALAGPAESYRSRSRPGCPDPADAVRAWAADAGEFPKTPPADAARVAEWIRGTPFGDRMTLDLALDLLEHELPGAAGDGVADLLAIGFSACDYIGHRYGPDSLEYEDQLLQLDARVAELLDAVDRRIGLDRTLVVLTADHGGDSATAWLERSGQPTGRLVGAEFVPRLNAALRERFAVDADLVLGFRTPNLYLDLDRVAALGLERADVADALARVARALPGVGSVYVWSESGPVRRAGHVGWYDELVARSFHASRSGEVILVPRRHVYLGGGGSNAATHGSPFDYDSGVPLVLMGPGVRPGRVGVRVSPRQIAPTLAAVLGLEPEARWPAALP